jgi:pimeloyl-ACP methyl ester carboxylesterase
MVSMRLSFVCAAATKGTEHARFKGDRGGQGAMILHAVERGAGPPLALLHGLFGQSTNFATAQRRLAEGRRVIALDLRNHGASPRAPAMAYPDMAEDVLETLRMRDALPCALLGHSMGGKVAMCVALEAPAAVSRLLVADVAPVAYDHTHVHAPFVQAMAAVPLHPGLTRAEADAALATAAPDPATRGFLLQNLKLGAAPSWRVNLEAVAAGLPGLVGWPEMEGTYPGPTLFVAGARSDYLRAAYRPAIHALFPAARFVTLKHAGHWLHADDPDGFARVVEAFAPAG